MGKKLPPDQLELYKRIDEFLFYKWDSIGISDGDWARDEYQSYLPRVALTQWNVVRLTQLPNI
ncbi:hypothetical protein Q8W30_14745 [Neptunomonas phycophila]|uniref:Uncharacterized protein n=1 Tax=Neptunomonas phycophila TaxID=1572645 RepID=A0ABT9EXU2_9GAMM|nr:hypothetical protein [Neptunomonas phycophila]MDP2523831.1 hypothetical protein [Neptunomonas phycophila]